ncbi:hypothetical protein OH807_01845 [Kitasatospora sp. NBC_01560]|uniref:hypothetical protein n=1 Tax=Kitasatospora sp. NBC_01560 TaxID=2975965 RepID=UPI00386FBE31
MKRGLLTATATLLLATAAGCGSVHTADPGPSTEASRSSQADQARQAAEESARQALAEHDRRYPEVGKGCATATGTPSPSASASVPPDPDSGKYAENHAYKQTVPLTAPARCRGDAHAARIRAALGARKAGAATDLQTTLESLGYAKEAFRVTANGSPAAGFVLEVPGAGPCIEGRPGNGQLSVAAHGYYLDGGCAEPKGGH